MGARTWIGIDAHGFNFKPRVGCELRGVPRVNPYDDLGPGQRRRDGYRATQARTRGK
jgi:hypothetical protein